MRSSHARAAAVVFVALLAAACTESSNPTDVTLPVAPAIQAAVSTPPVTAATAGRVTTGPGAALPAVRSFDLATLGEVSSLLAYPPEYAGGVTVATGDVNGDGTPDLVTGAADGPAHVKVFDGASGAEILSFFAFPAAFTGGVSVGVGDVTGDGHADIVVGARHGVAHVKVFDGASGEVVASFFAFNVGFTGGAHVAAGDVNGDGRADIVVGAGPGGWPHVKVFDGAAPAVELASFFAYSLGLSGGVHVAAGDVDGDGLADIVTGAGPGGAPEVRAFSVGGRPLRAVVAFDPGFAGGVRVAAADVNGDGRAEIAAAAGPGGGPHVRVFDGVTGTETASFLAYDPGFAGGVFVALAQGMPGGSVGIDGLVARVDASVAAGGLTGAGSGRSAASRLATWLAQLESARTHEAAGETEEACGRLLWLHLRADGERSPPDFVTGADVAEIATLLVEVRGALGCG